MTLRCPNADEIATQAIALLPRGRAWRTHDIGPRPGTVLYGYWRSVAEVFAHVAARVCALREEFWCATKLETTPEWMAEYGLPDECDPYPDLCEKIAALGGATCDVYRDIAARAGWDIDCIDLVGECGDLAGAMLCGNDIVGGSFPAARVAIRVYLETSPAYTDPISFGPFSGCFQSGLMLDCEPDISRLICVLDRVIHAHVLVSYAVGDPRTTLTDAPITADSGASTDGWTN